ncbi:hypothetical protein [bacterium endosymbiont of Bathymodiolus sp. 5 South]|jgi:hypothetical protein|uniref:hypothetical protein n=1 Tax=bacterium endosymbiont of Bathymodiolus sp. 5 South TaxID=1181670 RepID=UPI0010BA53F9|nr:hypothetical protein [bacterium endosymbiont of Bathymodiolus sp. 5 South]CAC9657393.1 hypothetical protein [uncultured Gammaproteobacteria bacterium]SHN92436.1 hypothetical protein BCLUESOX_2524 [bacterium endosymbiont of Bathymodiolus sp. 5 South]SSC06839.1 hypothetical protein BTURTLESOX_2313 [bacterium endosymbiont of Bathymodiolus sp. 5 South]VVH56533.1 hypothetical protein BSPCLSOX_893 [uncultured Gammaproteobacteria bacterium]VVM23344.1 hypothetical protein BSPWISOXPB_514 [uncultured
MPDNQIIKKDEKHKFTPLEKRFVKIYLLLTVFYSIVSVYLLNTPIDEWVFNLGQYNNQLLQWLPRAQYWVNISVAYREKMILLYVLYQGIFWFTFVSTIGIFIKDWAWYKENAMYRTNKKIRDARNKKKYWMAFGVFFFGVFTYLSITQSLFMGSEYFMLYEDLDKVGRHNDILVWNKIYGFTFYRTLLVLFLWATVWYFIHFILITKTLFTNNSNKENSNEFNE